MWCLRCYEPVRQLTPRDPGEPTVTFLRDHDDGPERSRWKAGVNTFGPFGRVLVTVLVLLIAPLSLNLVSIVVLLPCYLVLASVVLHAVWKKDRVLTTSHAEVVAKSSSPGEPVPPAPVPIPRSTIVAYVVGGLLLAAAGIVWSTTGEDLHAALAVCGALGLLVVVVRWLLRP